MERGERFTSVVSYGLVAVFSVLAVCGGALRDGLFSAQPRQVGSGAGLPPADLLPLATPDGRPPPLVPVLSPASPRPVQPPQPAPVAALPAGVDGTTLARLRDLARQLDRPLPDPEIREGSAGGGLAGVWATLSPGLQARWGSQRALADFQASSRRAYGEPTAILAEALVARGDLTYYTRTATYERGPADGWTLILALNPAGQVEVLETVGASRLPARLRALRP